MTAMKTRHVSNDDLTLFLLGEIPGDKKESLQKHLDACASCRGKLQSERAMMNILKRQPVPVPPESVLSAQRARLMQRLRAAAPAGSGKSLRERLMETLRAARPYRLQWATVAAVFCAGILAGRLAVFQGDHGSAPVREALSVLESSVPTGGFEVAFTGPEKDGVEIRFKTIQDYVLKGKPGDRDIQRMLLYVLRNSPGDHIRLRALNALALGRPGREEVRDALIQTLEKDSNPGVRMKAIRLLVDAFPVNQTAKDVLVRAFFRDSNEGIRIEAANSLRRIADPDVLPLLRQEASNNPYVRSLLGKNDGT
jgi:hypothetical protein